MGKTITSIVTLTVAIILTYASTASAGGFTSDPVKTDRAYIKDHYITKTIKTPNPSTQTCREVDVPIYGNTGGSTDGAEILGAIIGGVIGSKIGSGDGSKVATGVGAVIGGIGGLFGGGGRDDSKDHLPRKRAKKTARKINKYNDKLDKVEAANRELIRDHTFKTRKSDWRRGKEIQDFQYGQSIE